MGKGVKKIRPLEPTTTVLQGHRGSPGITLTGEIGQMFALRQTTKIGCCATSNLKIFDNEWPLVIAGRPCRIFKFDMF